VEALRFPSSLFTFTHNFLAVSDGTVQTQVNAYEIYKLILAIDKKLDHLGTKFEETQEGLLEKSDEIMTRVQRVERNTAIMMTRASVIFTEGLLVQIELLATMVRFTLLETGVCLSLAKGVQITDARVRRDDSKDRHAVGVKRGKRY
jgi:hypothetical protein